MGGGASKVVDGWAASHSFRKQQSEPVLRSSSIQHEGLKELDNFKAKSLKLERQADELTEQLTLSNKEKDVLETRIQKFDSERALVHQERDGMKRRLELLATERDKLVQDIAELRVKYEASVESRDAAYDELALIKRTQKEVLDKAAKEIQMLKDQASKDAAETSRKLQEAAEAVEWAERALELERAKLATVETDAEHEIRKAKQEAEQILKQHASPVHGAHLQTSNPLVGSKLVSLEDSEDAASVEGLIRTAEASMEMETILGERQCRTLCGCPCVCFHRMQVRVRRAP